MLASVFTAIRRAAAHFEFAMMACAIPLGGVNRCDPKSQENGSSSVEGAILTLIASETLSLRRKKLPRLNTTEMSVAALIASHIAQPPRVKIRECWFSKSIRIEDLNCYPEPIVGLYAAPLARGTEAAEANGLPSTLRPSCQG